MNKRILISFLGFVEGGGELLPLHLANALYEAGENIYVHVLIQNDNKQIRALLHPQIPVIHCNRTWRMLLFLIFHRISTVHCNEQSGVSLFARIKKRVPFLRFRLLVTEHGTLEGISKELAKEQFSRTDTYVDHYVGVAGNNIKMLQMLGASKQRMTLIPNGLQFPKEVIPKQRAQFHIPSDSFLVTVITRAIDKKCWPECIETVRIARERSGRDIRLLLCGTGTVYDKLKDKGVPDYVVLGGSVVKAWDYYAMSDLGMLLSIKECAPLGIIEMYIAGIPCLATDVGDVSSMIGTDETGAGLVVPLQEPNQIPVEEAADALVKLAEDKALYEGCKQHAIARRENYSMDTVVREYQKLYQNIPL